MQAVDGKTRTAVAKWNTNMEVVMGAARWPNYEVGWGGGGVEKDDVTVEAPASAQLTSWMTPTELQVVKAAEGSHA